MKNTNGYKIYKNSIDSKSSIKLFNSFLKVLNFCGKGKNFKSFSKIKNWQSPELHKN